MNLLAIFCSVNNAPPPPPHTHRHTPVVMRILNYYFRISVNVCVWGGVEVV